MSSPEGTNEQYICELHNISKSIGTVSILRNLSFSVKKGKVTALLGENGSGKTTTIRVIMGLLKPDTGRMNLLGNPYSGKVEDYFNHIGLLPQDNAGYRQFTAYENIDFILKLHKLSIKTVQEEFDYLIDTLDLREVLHSKWGTLSGGETRAFGFIRAILTGKTFLILDEPTTGLDIARAVQIRRIIQEQVEKGKSVLMSSHIITDLEKLAQDIVILKKGQVIFTGSKQEAIEKYSPEEQSLENALVNSFTSRKRSVMI